MKNYNKKKQLNVRLKPDTYYKIKYISNKLDIPVNSIIEKYLISYIDKYQDKYGNIELEKDFLKD